MNPYTDLKTALITPLRPQGGAIKQIAPHHQRTVVTLLFQGP